jgi:hypothetical protein
VSYGAKPVVMNGKGIVRGNEQHVDQRHTIGCYHLYRALLARFTYRQDGYPADALHRKFARVWCRSTVEPYAGCCASQGGNADRDELTSFAFK